VFRADDDPLAVAATEAVLRGDLELLRALLTEHPGLANAETGDRRPGGMSRSLLHAATDWPGHHPNNVASVQLLLDHGADVNAVNPRCPDLKPKTTLARSLVRTGRAWSGGPLRVLHSLR